ncbi:hypothetical protein HK104_003004 [Borealophlyctis nickersoniae]|nr:hypothetical protein HK104_003004 [Borealophlyctis nickersoniae]
MIQMIDQKMLNAYLEENKAMATDLVYYGWVNIDDVNTKNYQYLVKNVGDHAICISRGNKHPVAGACVLPDEEFENMNDIEQVGQHALQLFQK